MKILTLILYTYLNTYINLTCMDIPNTSSECSCMVYIGMFRWEKSILVCMLSLSVHTRLCGNEMLLLRLTDEVDLSD